MDAKEFKREDRYAVIKYKKLSSTQWTKLPTMLDSFASACVDCVVIEKDWPEYNFVWLMIEHRMAGFPVPDFNAVKCAADVAIAEQRLADAERRNAELVELLQGFRKAVEGELNMLRLTGPSSAATTLATVLFKYDCAALTKPEEAKS